VSQRRGLNKSFTSEVAAKNEKKEPKSKVQVTMDMGIDK